MRGHDDSLIVHVLTMDLWDGTIMSAHSSVAAGARRLGIKRGRESVDELPIGRAATAASPPDEWTPIGRASPNGQRREACSMGHTTQMTAGPAPAGP